MDPLAAGFWGAFFGTAFLMSAATLAAWLRSRQRVALMAGLSAVVSAVFVATWLGWLPGGPPALQARVMAHVAVGSAIALGLMLLLLLGLLRRRDARRRAVQLLLLLGALVLGFGAMLEPQQAMALSAAMAIGVALAMLAVAARRALRGDRLAWSAVCGVSCMLVALGGLSWIALHPGSPWAVHALSAGGGMAYLSTMAAAMWSRYSYLLELSQVMAHGPAYDPVTRLLSHSETGQMVGDAFFRREGARAPIGVIVVSIANLYALEKLHGRAAFNHALFVCASRLRRSVPADVGIGRLAEDGFLLLLRAVESQESLGQLAAQVHDQLSRPVVLTGHRVTQGSRDGEAEWRAEVGVGVLFAGPQVRPSQAVATARAMSRTAWTYGSRVACLDLQAGRVAEFRAAGPA